MKFSQALEKESPRRFRLGAVLINSHTFTRSDGPIRGALVTGTCYVVNHLLNLLLKFKAWGALEPVVFWYQFRGKFNLFVATIDLKGVNSVSIRANHNGLRQSWGRVHHFTSRMSNRAKIGGLATQFPVQ